MEIATFAVEAEVEQHHWWFVGRRRLLKALIEELGLPPEAAVLDLGTGTGAQLRLLGEMGFANRSGVDLHDEAIRWCAEKGLGEVRKGDVRDVPFADETFDLVLATDIIEHVEDDGRALSEVRRVLKKGGHALITVPAFEALWGRQDDVAHHKRRYRRPELLGKIEAARLSCRESFYFNYLLFAPTWAARQVIRLLGIQLDSENQVNTPGLNRILTKVFELDVRTARALRPPCGVSILAVATR
jgi:SAM-dependent methyltransferase